MLSEGHVDVRPLTGIMSAFPLGGVFAAAGAFRPVGSVTAVELVFSGGSRQAGQVTDLGWLAKVSAGMERVSYKVVLVYRDGTRSTSTWPPAMAECVDTGGTEYAPL